MDLPSINKFDGTNFHSWKFQRRNTLMALDLLEIATGEEKAPKVAKTDKKWTDWRKRNAKAMTVISATLERPQIEYLLTCDTAEGMWKKLGDLHEQKSTSSKLLLMNRFHEHKMSSTDTVSQHITKVVNMARQLNDVGEAVSNCTIISKIVGTLPPRFSAFVSAWDSVEEDRQTLENLTQRLLKEESRTEPEGSGNAALTATNKYKHSPLYNDRRQGTRSSKKPSKSFRCYSCGKEGHLARNCRLKKGDEGSSDSSINKNKDKPSSAAFAALTDKEKNEILNSKPEDI